LNENQEQLPQPLRIAAFGTSHTFGAQLEDRFNEAYPWLLSLDATNLALKSSGPSYPAACTESMVGDDAIFDVIILEFHLRATEGLDQLALRLRERFPDAMIIFVKIWFPQLVIRSDTRQRFLRWIEENVGQNVALHGKELSNALAATQRSEWTYAPHRRCGFAVQDAADAVGGYIYELPRPEDPRQAIIQHSDLFDADYHHMSTYGHQVVADDLTRLINKYARRSDRLGTWGGGDSCLSWFSSGRVAIPYERHMQITNFEDGKYALEVSDRGGFIVVENPFQDVRSLYLTYMAYGPAPSIYPQTEVFFSTPSHGHSTPVLIDPTVDDCNGVDMHIAKVSKVGLIPPGKVDLQIFPIERANKGFRVTGFSLTSEELNEEFEIPRSMLRF